MAKIQGKSVVCVSADGRSVSTEFVSFDILELGQRTVRICTEQRNDAAAIIADNQALNRGNTSIKNRLALKTRDPRRP